MRHWLTDISLYALMGNDGGCCTGAWYMFHFLRVLGWKTIAECDNTSITVASHIPDGCMDNSGVTNWTVVGTASRAKSTTQLFAGYRCLTFTTAATGDGVQSAVFTSMTISKPYGLSLWVWNNCGHALRVYVNNGSGSYVLAGSVPHNAGVWTRYQFSYTSHTVVTACCFKIVDEVGTVGVDQVYVDQVYTAQPSYETAIRGSGTDGVVEAGNNKFSSASYAFTDADVTALRAVCFADLVNEGNSGIYRIIGRDGTKAVLDIKDDGTNYLVAATGLAFRILDKADIPSQDSGAGFCIESPHSTHWRWKYRMNNYYYGSGGSCGQGKWASSPDPCHINVDTFQFYRQHRSTARTLVPDTSSINGFWNSAPPAGWTMDFFCLDGIRNSTSPSRFYAVTDGETYIFGLHRVTYPAAWFMGFLGDAYRDLRDTFCHFQERYDGENGQGDTLHFANSTRSFNAYGVGFGKRGLGMRACLGSAGWGTTTGVTEYMTNAKANPFGGKEMIRPFMAFLDVDGVGGEFATIEATNHDFGHCRSNLTLWNHFGTSKEWFHAKSGLCIAWHGRGVQP